MADEIEIQVPNDDTLAAPVTTPAVPAGAGDDDEQNPEGAPATPAGDPGTEQPPRKGGFQRKLDKEVQKRTSAERERDYWRDAALAKNSPEGKGKPAEQTTEAAASQPAPQPMLKDFDDWDKYFAANNEWMRKEAERIADTKVSAGEKRRQDQEQERQKQADDRKLQEAFNEREEKASKKHKDWEEVAGTGDDPTVFVELQELHTQKAPSVPVIAATLRDADPEGDLEYYLASNLDEVARIAKLPPVQASLELGKLLGTKLAPQESSAVKATAATATSKANPPPRTLGKTSPTATGVNADLAKSDPDEYWKRRVAQRQKKR